MEVITRPEGMAQWSAESRRKGLSIGYVPTMGALHEGHLDLVRKAQEENARTACSIFVNPLQFNDPADFARYPIRTAEDQRLLEIAGCDVLFHPTAQELFDGFVPRTYDLEGLDQRWEGPLRPGHFQGVVNVVHRLFSFVRPDTAYFGEKDRQQLAIIQRVANRLHWPERIVPCPTVREADGLAMSSRNLRLSDQERAVAPVLHKALSAIASSAFRTPVPECLREAEQIINREPSVRLEYIGVADKETLKPLEAWPASGGAVALVAARLGQVRLIDNVTLSNPTA